MRIESTLVLDRMCRRIAHRGPDDQGMLVSGAVALGMRRLSVIDLAGGQQPISGCTSAVTIVFNGEIYNYRELQRTTSGRGHQFKTHSDTETILHAYEEFGVCVRRPPARDVCFRHLGRATSRAFHRTRSSRARSLSTTLLRLKERSSLVLN